MARGLKFRIKIEEGLFYIRITKTKVLISFAVTPKLICVFVFAYAKLRISHDEAHLGQLKKRWSKSELMLTKFVVQADLLYFDLKRVDPNMTSCKRSIKVS